MFKLQKLSIPSSITLHYHVGGTPNVSETKRLQNDIQTNQRERSLSPDSLEQRLLKQQLINDDLEDEESLLTSSSSMMDSISVEQSTRPSQSTKNYLKTITSHGFFSAFSFSDENPEDDIDDDFDEIQFDPDDVNHLFSDNEDAVVGRFSNESVDMDEEYDDDDSMSAEFCSNLRILATHSNSSNVPDLSDFQQQQQYSNYHFLDPISEAASEEERRAAVSIIRQQYKHKHSTSSSLSVSVNGHYDDDVTLNDDLSTLSDIDEQDNSNEETNFAQICNSIFSDHHVHKKRRYQRENLNLKSIVTKKPIDNVDDETEDSLERLRNITKMFTTKHDDEESTQALKKVEKLPPADKIRNTFQKFQEIASSNGQMQESDDDDSQPSESGGATRFSRKKKVFKETVPYHEMAEVKDKFEKGLVDSTRPKPEKRLDVRVQSGLASSKKQAFEQGEFAQEVEPHVSKVEIETDLVAGLALAKRQAFEQGAFAQETESNSNKIQIDRELVAGLTSAKKQAFEQGAFAQDKDENSNRIQIETDLVAGLASAKKQAFEHRSFTQETAENASKVKLDPELLAGLASAKKQVFEQGVFNQDNEFNTNKVQIDKDLVAGLASAKKQAFEHGEFAQDVEPHVSKVAIDKDLVAGLASSKKQAFEQGNFGQDTESNVNKVHIEANLVAGLASAKKQAFETNQLDNETSLKKSVIIDRDSLAGAATEKKAKFERGEFNQDSHEMGSNRVQADAELLAGAATEKKAKFESGLVNENSTTTMHRDQILTFVETGLAQSKRSELLSKIDAEQQVQRSGDRHIDIDLEQRSAAARRDQLEQLANNEFKPVEKQIDVTTGLANTIKEQFMADVSKSTSVKTTATPVSIESGLAKSRATAFENPDETTTIKRTVEIDNELLDRGVAKERMAMFKNLQSGAQPSEKCTNMDSKIRVDRVEFSDTLVNMSVRLKLKPTNTDKNPVSDVPGEENGNIVRESDKREEIYFEKGQTKNLVEQWKTKQISPDRDTTDAQLARDADILQQGKAKNLVEMWKTMDKENTPPPERRGVRAMTPASDSERSPTNSHENESSSRKPGYADDKANIESGHAKAIRERLMQTVEQSNNANARKTLKQVTPPPQSIDDIQKSMVSTDSTNGSTSINDQYNNGEEIVPTKGQAQSLKNRFAELEKDALKVETASSKIKLVPKRFVDTPAPKQLTGETTVDSKKCAACDKTVYAMEKIEADKKVYHKSCFKCMHCKTVLKLGNYTANDGQIYCKPHFLQLFAIKGNYSAGFGLNDHKARWLPTSTSPSSSSNQTESISVNEN